MTESLARVPWYPLVFPLFYGALAVFGLLMARHLRLFAAARPARPFSDVPRRTAALVRYALVQTRMFRDVRVGVMHYAIFAAFAFLSVGVANAVTGGLVEAVLAAPFDGATWAAVLLCRNVAAVLALGALAYALVRRLVVRPARLTLSRSGILILLLIGGIVAAELGALSYEAARYGPLPGAVITNAAGSLLAGADPGLLGALFAVHWWAHVGLVAVFLVWLPTTKHLHVVTSFFNVYLRKLEPRGALPAMDLEAADATYGLRTLADLAWKDVLDGFTCTECGRCQDVCPAHVTGKPLNPKELVMGIRHVADAAERGLPLIPSSRPDVRARGGPLDDRLAPATMAIPLVPGAISEDAVWDCVTCGACVEACPVLIEHVDKIVGIRRNLVLEESRFPAELAPAFRAMESAQNPWGQPRSARLDWTKGLPFQVPTAAAIAAAGELDSLEVLYWVGCAAAFDERNRRVARAFATCLHAAGVRFAVLGQEEACTGDPARRMGNEYVFQLLAAQNVETLRRYRPPRIVTACPHCFNTIANEYPQLGGTFEVIHHSAFLARLLDEGRLATLVGTGGAGAATRRITFHDACYLARYNGVVAAPRDVLGAVQGLELAEMELHGRQSFCCGAGGGRMWMEESRGTRINAERARQALATGAEAVAVGCPFCMTMLGDGLAADPTNASGVTTLDLAEILAPVAVAGPSARRPGRELPILQ
ncbi:MAG TPA: heterodisulfide reductase-related iron-sulfur binding cluster [Candidatus Nanopelagicales bacterium]|nr:heterodisulfide reductase-related iron-sulfur binding cluster [Candidatus Nanopelagicales bacterium]